MLQACLPQLNPRYRILYITKNTPQQGTLERSVLSDRLLVAYVLLPTEGSASVPWVKDFLFLINTLYPMNTTLDLICPSL